MHAKHMYAKKLCAYSRIHSVTVLINSCKMYKFTSKSCVRICCCCAFAVLYISVMAGVSMVDVEWEIRRKDATI